MYNILNYVLSKQSRYIETELDYFYYSHETTKIERFGSDKKDLEPKNKERQFTSGRLPVEPSRGI